LTNSLKEQRPRPDAEKRRSERGRKGELAALERPFRSLREFAHLPDGDHSQGDQFRLRRGEEGEFEVIKQFRRQRVSLRPSPFPATPGRTIKWNSSPQKEGKKPFSFRLFEREINICLQQLNSSLPTDCDSEDDDDEEKLSFSAAALICGRLPLAGSDFDGDDLPSDNAGDPRGVISPGSPNGRTEGKTRRQRARRKNALPQQRLLTRVGHSQLGEGQIDVCWRGFSSL